MRRAEITLADQFEKRKNWKNPLVDSVVATFLFRKVGTNRVNFMDRFEFLVTERVKGAEKGQFQAHHGGFMQVTDRDIYDGAAREVREETGYNLPRGSLTYLTTVGPALYRSELSYRRHGPDLSLNLFITKDEAEPSVGFTLPLFLADVTDMTVSNETDGEVKGFRWMTPHQIIEEFGKKKDGAYSRFNYFQMFVSALLYLNSNWVSGHMIDSAPGRYSFTIVKGYVDNSLDPSSSEYYTRYGRGTPEWPGEL